LTSLFLNFPNFLNPNDSLHQLVLELNSCRSSVKPPSANNQCIQSSPLYSHTDTMHHHHQQFTVNHSSVITNFTATFHLPSSHKPFTVATHHQEIIQ
ncbi:hypothetical protein Ancab_024570, partial [Ancistrocladus abbreviatus]